MSSKVNYKAAIRYHAWMNSFGRPCTLRRLAETLDYVEMDPYRVEDSWASLQKKLEDDIKKA